ncbi:MAG: flagellar biosynthesis anti-sigma factor FlgM [Candidatus Korobacteraceae bacterium]
MNIDSIRSAGVGISTDQNAPQVKKGGVGWSSADSQAVRATLSSDVSAVGALVTRAMQTPEVRQDRIDALRASVGNGSYSINANQIAASMLKEQSE